ncbi:MAG: hypothetical protein J6R79_03370 [Bacteroidaceae bacterium]|nr:hypothetical protein [Bacteroidaceae bacterium]
MHVILSLIIMIIMLSLAIGATGWIFIPAFIFGVLFYWYLRNLICGVWKIFEIVSWKPLWIWWDFTEGMTFKDALIHCSHVRDQYKEFFGKEYEGVYWFLGEYISSKEEEERILREKGIIDVKRREDS